MYDHIREVYLNLPTIVPTAAILNCIQTRRVSDGFRVTCGFSSLIVYFLNNNSTISNLFTCLTQGLEKVEGNKNRPGHLSGAPLPRTPSEC